MSWPYSIVKKKKKKKITCTHLVPYLGSLLLLDYMRAFHLKLAIFNRPYRFLLVVSSIGKKVTETWAREVGSSIIGELECTLSFILRKFKPIPKPFWTGLLFSCMNTRTLWLHKGILDTQCRVLLLRAMGYCCFFPLHWVAAGFLHWIAAACNVWTAVFLFCTDFSLGTGFSWQHRF